MEALKALVPAETVSDIYTNSHFLWDKSDNGTELLLSRRLEEAREEA